MEKCNIFTLCILFIFACGKEGNLADCEEGQSSIPCSERTSEEDARIALDNGDYETAIEILEALIKEDDKNYGNYSLVASAYALKSNVSPRQLAQTQFSEDGNALDQMKLLVPSPDDVGSDKGFALLTLSMERAIQWLKDIPDHLRSATSTQQYASSARIQLVLYQMAYAAMSINQFSVDAANGNLDEEKLATMSEEDAVKILTNMAEAGALGAGEEGAAISEKVNQAIAEIQQQEGAGNKEKLIKSIIESSQNP